MLGSDNCIFAEYVFEEIIKTNLPKAIERDLLTRLKKYEGHNDNFNEAEKVVRKKLRQ